MDRRFSESEAAARARAEVDPATRDRITRAHDLLGAAHGVASSSLRRLGAERLLAPSDAALGRAGLTRGEAAAAGLFRPKGRRRRGGLR